MNSKQQGRLDGFFKVEPKDPKDITKKRKGDDKSKDKGKKAKAKK
jgi:flap endonuclease-1